MISSWVMTYTAAGALAKGSGFLATEVTTIFPRSCSDSLPRLCSAPCGHAAPAQRPANNRTEILEVRLPTDGTRIVSPDLPDRMRTPHASERGSPGPDIIWAASWRIPAATSHRGRPEPQRADNRRPHRAMLP